MRKEWVPGLPRGRGDAEGHAQARVGVQEAPPVPRALGRRAALQYPLGAAPCCGRRAWENVGGLGLVGGAWEHGRGLGTRGWGLGTRGGRRAGTEAKGNATDVALPKCCEEGWRTHTPQRLQRGAGRCSLSGMAGSGWGRVTLPVPLAWGFPGDAALLEAGPGVLCRGSGVCDGRR